MLTRIVGGRYHNTFIDAIAHRIVGEGGIYHLALFYTDRGTEYVQYVHDSMFRGDVPVRAAFSERLAKWDLPADELKQRLREAIQSPSPVSRP